MLPKTNRIDKQLFKEIMDGPTKNFSSDILNLKVNFSNLDVQRLSESDSRAPSFAFVVSAKVSKKAVVRNKLKRRARAIIAKILPKARKDTRAILFFKKGAESLDFLPLEQKILDIFKQARVF